MIEDPNLTDLWRIKENLAGRFATVKEYAQAVQKFASAHPLPPAGVQRKMIDGFPRGQSVSDDDEIMRELRAIREKMLAEHGGDVKKLFASFRKESGETVRPRVKLRKNPVSFRSTKAKATSKHNGHH